MKAKEYAAAESYQTRQYVRCSLFDAQNADTGYLLSDGKRHWQVSYVVSFVVKTLAERRTEEEIQTCAIQDPGLGEAIPKDILDTILVFLRENGMLEGSEQKKGRRRTSAMWIKIPLLGRSTLRHAEMFSVLYSRQLMPVLGTLGMLWLIYVMTRFHVGELARSVVRMPGNQLAGVWAVLCLVTVFHEFGHAAALIRGGGSPGGMGFGLYYFLPVAWSDVTEAWDLPRRERLMVDCGGVYFQLTAASLLYLANELFLHSHIVRLGTIVSASTVAANLSPVLRFDGYWIACDGFGITDPVREAGKILLPSRYGKSGMPDGKKAVFAVFLLASSVILAYFYVLMAQMTVEAFQTIWQDIRFAALDSGGVIAGNSWQQAAAYLRTRAVDLLVVFFLLSRVPALFRLSIKKAGTKRHR